MGAINNPQQSLRCVHIAGTKGKGSTCAFIAYILKAAGFKTGLYTSPHLSDFRERIRILNPKRRTRIPQPEFEGMIPKNALTNLVEKIKPAIEKYNRICEYGPLSFFEVYTALAFMYFKKMQVDFVVLETGLGGRLDATNAVNPCVCVITPISYEHTRQLGNSLREITAEKAGIIKSNGVVITAPQAEEARRVLRGRCAELGAKLYEVGKDITFRKTKNGFSVEGVFMKYPNLKLRLLGGYQLINAAAALGAVEALRHYNIKINSTAIKNGFYNTAWPGRCEIVLQKPYVVLDGAQNIASAGALKQAINENFKYNKLTLVLGVSKDKDIKGICRIFYNLADKVILTKADNPRAALPETIERYFKGKETYLTNSVKEAMALATAKVNPEDLILVAGSLFVVGAARELF